MQPQMQLENAVAAQAELTPKDTVEVAPQWSLAKRIGFRFMMAYVVSFCFSFTPYWLGFTQTIFAKYDLFLHRVAIWYARHIIHLGHEITVFSNGSGDTTYDWILLLCYLTFAAMVTVVWTLLDRKRSNYIKLNMWFRTYMRLFLAGTLLLYGAIKAFPLQMPYPSYTRLLEPYGESSPMGILWAFIGASPAYCAFTGIVEATAGTLLLFPRLTTLGSLLGTAAMGQVFILNMCYDVPVKILSFHLLLIAVILLMHDFRRLTDLLIFNRKTEPVKRVPLFTSKWTKRIAATLAIIYGVYAVGGNFYDDYQGYKSLPRVSGNRPALYGIWNVDEYTVDGAVQPPLITDQTRWQKLIVQSEGFAVIKPMTGPNQGFALKTDLNARTLEFSKAGDKNWKANLSIEKPDNDSATLTGQWEGHNIQAKLKRFDESKFLLTNRGFHWISETPFNR